MLSETTLNELRMIAGTNPEAGSALADLERTIAAQALVIRNLSSELRNRRVSQAYMDALVSGVAMNTLREALGSPARGEFSLAEAQQAGTELLNQATRARDGAALAAALVRLVSVFV